MFRPYPSYGKAQSKYLDRWGDLSSSIRSTVGPVVVSIDGENGVITAQQLADIVNPLIDIPASGAYAYVDPTDSGVVIIDSSGGGGPSAVAPVVTIQPVPKTVAVGGNTFFGAEASGTPTPTAQWQINGVDVPGETGPNIGVTGATSGQNGNLYRVVYTNSAGSVTSNAVALTVSAAVAPVVDTITWPSAMEVYLANQVYWTVPTGTAPITVTIEALPAGEATGTFVNIPWYTAPSIVASGTYAGRYTSAPNSSDFLAGTTRRFRLKATNTAGTWYSAEITINIVDNS